MQTIVESSPDERLPLSFPEWNTMLWRTHRAHARTYSRIIVEFLKFCRDHHAPASVELARMFLRNIEPEVAELAREALRWFVREAKQRERARAELCLPRLGDPTGTRESRIARAAPVEDRRSRASDTSELAPAAITTDSRPEVPRSTQPATRIDRAAPPPLACTDLGGADWERDLVAAIRRKGFLWRTEQTYRAWAARFAQSCDRARRMPPPGMMWPRF